MESASASPTTNDYEAKISYEAAQLAERVLQAGFPRPFGDPLSGVLLAAEGTAASPRLVDALHRSLAAVKLDGAYVTWSSSNLLEEILSLEPDVLVAVGPTAARAIDALGYPLANTRFSAALEGSWFAWTKSTSGLLLPALAPALHDADAKRRFWRAFLTLRSLVPSEEPYPHY